MVQKIEKLLPAGWKLITEQSAGQWGKAILVCGCPVACADCPEVKVLAREWILISGPMIDFEGVLEVNMAEVVVRKIQL